MGKLSPPSQVFFKSEDEMSGSDKTLKHLKFSTRRSPLLGTMCRAPNQWLILNITDMGTASRDPHVRAPPC